jgi:4-hydroxyphenylacetate 3-monooxygenase
LESLKDGREVYFRVAVLPNAQSGSAYRVFAGDAYARIKEMVEKIVASSLIYLPSSTKDFGTEFGGRHELYEYNYAGNHEDIRIHALLNAKGSGAYDGMIALAEQCMADYDDNGWTGDTWTDASWADKD